MPGEDGQLQGMLLLSILPYFTCLYQVRVFTQVQLQL
jgi:hypothetical protein